MSFPRYPEYKASGVEWLGEVPTHWEVDRLKRVASVFPSNVDKKSYEDDISVRLCNYTDVYYNDAITSEMELMAATATVEQVEKFTLRAGDTIITKDSETADDIAISAYVPFDLPGVVCGYHLSVIRPSAASAGAFIKRLFDSSFVRSAVAVRANGLTRVGLGQYALDNLEIPSPPVIEQRIIAAFLDRETAKIDALVAEQRRLMELLKEKRQAVISHAVTKGLNPDAPMKASALNGVDAVPAHWSVCRLGDLVRHVSTGPFGSALGLDEYVAGGVPLINPSHIVSGGLEPEEHVSVSDETALRLGRWRMRVDDIVVARRGELGRAALIGQSHEGWLCGTGCLFIETDTARCLPAFLLTVIGSHFSRAWFQQWSVGSTMANLNERLLAALPVCCPASLDEQTMIVNGVQARLEEIGNLEKISAEVVRLLEDRRSSLISAAVTGQIDVRSLTKEEVA